MDTLKGWSLEEFREFFKKEELKDRVNIPADILASILPVHEPDDIFAALSSDIVNLTTHLDVLEIPVKLFDCIAKSTYVIKLCKEQDINSSYLKSICFTTKRGIVKIIPYE